MSCVAEEPGEAELSWHSATPTIKRASSRAAGAKASGLRGLQESTPGHLRGGTLGAACRGSDQLVTGTEIEVTAQHTQILSICCPILDKTGF